MVLFLVFHSAPEGPIPVTGKCTMNVGDTGTVGQDVFKCDRQSITARLLKNYVIVLQG